MVTRPADAPPRRYVAPCPAILHADHPTRPGAVCGSKERTRRIDTVADGTRTRLVDCAACGNRLHVIPLPAGP